jgi:hypothetical protein
MTTFNQSLTRIKRFLRDPDNNIWSDEDIRVFWNDAQIEVAQKIGYIERVHSYRYPPLYAVSYLYDWEYQHLAGDKYKCLYEWTQRDVVVCYPWEPGYYLTSMDTPDDGSRVTYVWETEYCTPADVVRLPLHEKFHKAKFVAFDERQVDPLSEKQIALEDSYYRTTTGEPINYYRPDLFHNHIVLYPRPSSVTWDDASWLLTDASESFGTAASDGIISYKEDAFDETGYGVIYDTIDTDGHLFMIFESLPDDVDNEEDTWDDELTWWVSFMIPTVEQATLERCYGADTDGFIPSLRDYWQMRKEVSIAGIKQFKNNRMSDRDFRIGGEKQMGLSPHPRLPSRYPRVYP